MNGNQGNKSLEIKIERKSLNTQQNLRLFNFYHGTDVVGAGSLKVKTKYILEFSVKSRKDSTSTLSLVINKVRFKKTLQKSTLERKTG
jgi:hypothetical protein